MNPYAKYLDHREPRAVMADTAARLAQFAAQLGPAGVRRIPAPGKWSAGAILCHLADCEIAFGWRLRQALAEPHHTYQPFDQNLWAADYETIDPELALAAFTAARRWNVALVDRMKPADFAKRVTHPERGEMNVQTVLETIAGHDLNHLEQLERMAAAR